MDTSKYAKIISKNLKRLAYDNGKMQTDIAKDLGLNPQTVSTWMTGKSIPRMPMIDMLCEYFHCKRSDIMEPYVPKELPSLSEHEMRIVKAYRKAPESRRESVRALLNIED